MLVDTLVGVADTGCHGLCVQEHGRDIGVPLLAVAGAVERGAPTQILKVTS